MQSLAAVAVAVAATCSPRTTVVTRLCRLVGMVRSNHGMSVLLAELVQVLEGTCLFFHNREVQHWHSALSRSSYTNQTEYSVIFWPCVDGFSIALVAQEIRRAWDDVAKNGTIVSGLSYYLFVTNGNFLFKSKWSSRVVESAYAVKVLLEAFCIDIHSLRSNFSHFQKDIFSHCLLKDALALPE